MECEKRKCLLLETKIEILKLVDECQIKKKAISNSGICIQIQNP